MYIDRLWNCSFELEVNGNNRSGVGTKNVPCDKIKLIDMKKHFMTLGLIKIESSSLN